GHREDRGEAAGRRGRGARAHGLRVLTARLPQVGVQVDEAGQEDETVGVDALDVGRGVLRRVAPDRGDEAVPDEDVLWGAAEERGPGDEQVGHPTLPSSEASRW